MNPFTSLGGNLELIEDITGEETIIQKTGYQTRLEREVTVKTLTPRAADNPRLRTHFIQEMRTLGSLNHPGLVRVYELGMDNNIPFAILEKVDGLTLQQRLDRLKGQRSALNLEEIGHIVCHVADVVAYVHQYNVPVRDLTLDNIVLATDERVVLTGLGQPLPENILTASTSRLAYASPERLAARRTDKQSDVYSLGVLLYHLLFGCLPFEGDAWGIILQKQTAETLPALDDPHTALNYPELMEHILRQATAKQPEHRFADAASFRAVLAYAVEGVREKPASLNNNGANHSNGTNSAAAALIGNTKVWPVVSFMEAGQSGFQAYRPAHSRNGHHLNTFDPKEVQLDTIIKTGKNNGRNGNHQNLSGPATQEDQAPASDLETTGLKPRSSSTTTDETETAGRQDTGAASTPDDIDPLMPGRDDPALQAALPYTLLVPMPAVPEEPSEEAVAPPTSLEVSVPFNYTWLMAMGLGGFVLSVVAALRFG